MKRFAVLLISFVSMTSAIGQTIRGTVKDASTNEPVIGATVSIMENGGKTVVTDTKGIFQLSPPSDGQQCHVKITSIGYKPLWAVLRDGAIYKLKTDVSAIGEVVVTAREGRGPVTSSVIGRDAMQHLQPNSIADLMELLPGGYSKDPDMGQANTIQLRETGTLGAFGQSTRSNNFSISSLGTQFIVDGAPINTDANLQYSPLGDTQSGNTGTLAEDYRNTTNKGVDMRSIGTDDIERVEVVRGIPSVEYGNLTSGIVNIRKIRRAMPLTARFKADGYSKLVSIGKGVVLGERFVLNADIGWLDSKIDPTDNLESYKRLNGSARLTYKYNKEDMQWQWNSGFDYTGSFDNAKQDPDINFGRIDEYRSNYNRMAFTNSLLFEWPKRLFRELEVNTSASLELDRLHEKRLVAPQRYGLVPTNFDDGEYEAGAVYAEYVASYLSDGKPFTGYVKAKGILAFDFSKTWQNRVKFGANYDYTKNYGDGQVYDMYHPLTVTGWSSRPRRYKDIPAIQNLSAFVEENFTWKQPFGTVTGMAGVRLNTMPGLSSKFDMRGKVYADPRVNINYQLPHFDVADKPMTIALNGGWGLTTKNPTLNYLYPDPYYSNFIELSYYDAANPERDSRFVVQSYKQDPTNYRLTPARNHKWEIRLDIDWADNSLSIDYFHERLNDGFRYSAIYGVYNYKSYDVSQMAAGVDWHTLPYTERQVLDGYQQASNGSRLVKQGIEFQFRSARIKPLYTRVNISGAWFHTVYTNSQPMFSAVTGVYGDEAISDHYVGLYDWRDGRENDRFNTNFTFDTQIPQWGLIFTTSVQCMWLVRTQMQEKDGYPIGYISSDDGKVHPYTSEDEADAVKQHLVRVYNETQFQPFTVPMSLIVNFKATKTVGKYLRLSFFANKILDYLPDYESNGNIIRRNASPYFGMEANVTI